MIVIAVLLPFVLIIKDIIYIVKKKENIMFEIGAFNSAWSADVVYLLMKPLEWIFVFVLYLFDERPEDRICKQYLPKEESR